MFFSASFFVLLAILHSGTSLTCWTCASTMNGDCAYAVPASMMELNCDMPQANISCIQYEQPADVEPLYVRSCQGGNDPCALLNNCLACTTDLCNSIPINA